MAVAAPQPPSIRPQLLATIGSAPRLGLMLGLAALIALLAGAWIWGQTPDYRVLYANLSDRDGGSIISALQQMNVPYKFAEGGGALLVPANQVHEVRLRLASQGLPRGSLVGFELMENQKLGTSQFQEQINYQRGLEGELARSIQSLAAVQSARVHLAISKPSVFVREQQKPSASVLLNLHPGRNLDAAQVSAIVHLVSSSVADLPVKNVTVVDQSGNLLTSPAGNTAGLDPGQLKYLHDLEQSYSRRIEAILAPLTGPNNVRAQVTADIDFSQTENIAETYRPNQTSAEAAVRSQQLTESSNAGNAPASGVPGALSNQPPAPATAPISAAAPAGTNPTATAAGGAAGAAPAPVSVRKDSTVNYEVDKTIRHTKQPVGAVKRLSVAVVVNHRKTVDAEGKSGSKPLSAEEMTQITELVKEVMGYNKERGDSLNVANGAFSVSEPDAVSELPLWKDPEVINTAKDIGKHLLIAAVVLFLVLGVLRPLLKSLAEARVRAAPAAQVETLSQRQGAGYTENLEMAKQLARQEPKLVANVVKNWVSGDAR